MADREITERRIVLVTGMSGAGMSSALSALEDLGYEAVDNLPLSLVPTLVAQGDLSNRPIAIGIDSRTRGFNAKRLLAQLTPDSREYRVVQQRIETVRAGGQSE